MTRPRKPYRYVLDITYTPELAADNEAPYYGECWQVNKAGKLINPVDFKTDMMGWSVSEVLINFMPYLAHMTECGCIVTIQYDRSVYDRETALLEQTS